MHLSALSDSGLHRRITGGFAALEMLLCNATMPRKNPQGFCCFTGKCAETAQQCLRLREICYRAHFLYLSQGYSITYSSGPDFKTRQCRWGQTFSAAYIRKTFFLAFGNDNFQTCANEWMKWLNWLEHMSLSGGFWIWCCHFSWEGSYTREAANGASSGRGFFLHLQPHITLNKIGSCLLSFSSIFFSYWVSKGLNTRHSIFQHVT